jgi:hypothetical protein
MIQPTLATSKECNIILLDGKAWYTSNPSRVPGGRKFAGDDDLYPFAEMALQKLTVALP